MKASDYRDWTPKSVREIIRSGEWTGPTPGMCAGFVQANLVVLPKDWAYDFLVFAQRNPIPCPILDITEPGDREARIMAPGSDVARDIPRYRVYKDGIMTDEPTDVSSYWKDDLVAFLLGCSFTFERALMEAEIPVRHIQEDKNVPMYITSIQCRSAGRLKGPMVVSMRPIPARLVSKAVMATGRYPKVHGAPVHVGDPEALGIKDLSKPDFGDSVTVNPGEIPVFWGCGVTPQAALMASKPPFAITHSPGHMMILDPRDSDMAAF